MELALFVITALITVGAALGMVLSHNAVHSALWLVLNFLGVAVLYLLLNAPFLAMIQITVYAGAIMVLFLFVIMLLGSEKGQEEVNGLPWQTPVALVLGLLLLGIAGYAVFGARGITLPAPSEVAAGYGNPESLGVALFTTYLLPLEVAGVLLLVALVGAVVLTFKSRQGGQA
ncbi:NADH-quinone oxidoreductase subunit J [Kallotenue papyrolyticum]|uniref:NADH-quinone oxidoreductase subunit J family protein n=1 Tax=Kallotenue papyrolyticum TaxID=1325125 RepID=UPI0004785C98|nr:NADH-quinone oxidoreductase subunit J [Kallotenue papyrolyticum]